MKRSLVLVVVSVVFVLLVAPQTQAAPIGSVEFTSAGPTALADFAHWTSDGCVFTSVVLLADSFTSNASSSSNEEADVNQENMCTGATGYGFIAGGLGRVTIAKNLSSATMSGTIPVVDDFSCDVGQCTAPRSVTVNTRWSANSLRASTTSNSEIAGHFCVTGEKCTKPQFVIVESLHMDGSYRGAAAAGAVTLPDGTNLTPDPAQSALLARATSLEVFVERCFYAC